MAEITLTKENFAQEVLQAELPVLVDFWAPRCAPCRMMGPVIADVAEHAKGFLVGKLDVDENPEVAIQYGVQSIPTLMVFKNGAAAAQAVGARPKAEVLALLAQAGV